MKNFVKIILKFFEHYNITLNLNILETGLINLFLLLILLAFASKEFVKPLLDSRKKIVSQSVKTLDDRVTNGYQNLKGIKNQLNNINSAIFKIKKEALLKKKNLLKSEAFQVENKLLVYFEEASLALDSLENKMTIDLKKKMVNQLLQHAISSTKILFASEDYSQEFMNNIIKNLQGHL